MPLDQPITENETLGDRVDEARMSFGEHLEELRMRLIRALMGVAVCAAVALFFGRDIVGWLIRPLATVLTSAGLSPQTIALTPVSGFAVYLKVSLVAGLVAASPWMIYQFWKFTESGLYAHERKAALILAPFSGVMSVLGVLFMYYLMLPITLAFLVFFTVNYPPPTVSPDEDEGLMSRLTGLAIRAGGGDADQAAEEETSALLEVEGVVGQIPVVYTDPVEPETGQMWIKRPEGHLRVYYGERVHSYAPLAGQSMVSPMLEIGHYISFVVLLTIGIVIAFQLPVVMLSSAWSGLLDPQTVVQYRKYCVFGCFVLGALATPADPISMFVLAMPIWGLFEFGILLMKFAYRRGEAEGEAYEDDDLE